jgi:hypothetical protein
MIQEETDLPERTVARVAEDIAVLKLARRLRTAAAGITSSQRSRASTGLGSADSGRVWSAPTPGGGMPTVFVYHDVKDKDHWLPLA